MRDILRILYVLFVVFFSLSGCVKSQAVAAEEAVEDEAEPTEELPYEKVPIERATLNYDGRKYEKKIDDMALFLSMYSDEELKEVKTLNLRWNNITKIEGLERLPNLYNLALDVNNIKKIENIPNLKNLYSIDLWRNEIEVIENLGHLTHLTHLTMPSNPLRNLDGLLELRGMVDVNIKTAESPYTREFLKIVTEFEENNKDTLESFRM